MTSVPSGSMRILVAGLLLFAVGCRDAPPVDTVTAGWLLHLRVLATHDIHGALEPAVFSSSGQRAVGGFHSLQHAMRELEETCECVTVRVDGGDQMQGTLVEAAGPRYYFSNLDLAFESAPGATGTSLAFPDGTPVRDDRSYTLATNDFLADGGDGLALLPTLPREATGVTLLDATIEQLRRLPSPVRIPREARELQVAGR